MADLAVWRRSAARSMVLWAALLDGVAGGWLFAWISRCLSHRRGAAEAYPAPQEHRLAGHGACSERSNDVTKPSVTRTQRTRHELAEMPIFSGGLVSYRPLGIRRGLGSGVGVCRGLPSKPVWYETSARKYTVMKDAARAGSDEPAPRGASAD